MEFDTFCVVNIVFYEFTFYLQFLCEKTHLYVSIREMSSIKEMDASFDKNNARFHICVYSDSFKFPIQKQ